MKRRALAALLAAAAHLGGATAAVEVNAARESELDGLPGLGPATTRQILAERARQPFADWQDLLARVKGLGPRNAARHSAAGLRVNGLAYPTPEPSDKKLP